MTLTETVRRETVPAGFRTPEPQKAEEFIQLAQWAASRPDFPQNLANTIKAGAWLQKVYAFRYAEQVFMEDGRYQELLGEHRAQLAELISDGENILFDIKNNGMVTPPSPQAFTEEALRSTLNSLHITFQCEHGPKNSSKTNEMISRLFDGPKP